MKVYYFKILILIFASGLFISSKNVGEPQKLALVISIDQYAPPLEATDLAPTRGGWTNLDGAVNDGKAMIDMLQAKYSFPKNNITNLFNADASRQNIIAQLNALISKAKKGDVVVIYYSGHGSQVKNSLSTEADKMDETIVPADVWKKGVMDIRDKEISVFLNQLLDKGVLLTVIFDSCHSGSIGRGKPNFLFDPPKTRYIEAADYDAKDAFVPERPEKKGALILSAAQDFEFAREMRDENNIPHGAFTMALMNALNNQNVDASVDDIFQSITSFMKFNGKTQEPVLAGNETRRKGTLLGLAPGKINNKMQIGLGRIEKNGVELNGGYAFGLSVGNRLANGKDTLEIIEMRDINKSFAKIVSGKKENLKGGSMFEIVNWTSSNAPALKIFIPNAMDENQLSSTIKSFQSYLNANKSLTSINDVLAKMPEKIVYWQNDNWNVNDNISGKNTLNSKPTSADLSKAIGTSGNVLFNLPPTTEFNTALRKMFESHNNISLVNNPNDAQYTLLGTMNNSGNISYSLIKSQLFLQDKTESLPMTTDAYNLTDKKDAENVAKNISEAAFKLAKIRAWSTLQSPANDAKFPFTLKVENMDSGEPANINSLKDGEAISFYFVSDSSKGIWKTNYKQRYIYLFAVDSKGTMSLFFPDMNSGNLENRFPVVDAANRAESKTHLVDIRITPPYGTDTYFLLSSETAINNLSLFEQEGVRTRGTKGAKNPLEDLLSTGAKTRGEVITPITWSMTKLFLTTKP